MISELMTLAGRSARRTVQNTVSRIVLWIAAGVTGGVAVGFLTGAGYLWLKRSWDGPAAAFIVALVYLLLAVALAVAATHVGSEDKNQPSTAEQMRALLPTVPAVLGVVMGMRRGSSRSSRTESVPLTERGKLMAERQVRRLGPLQRLGAGLLSGFIIGKIIDRRLGR